MRPASARLWLPASVLFLAAALLAGVLVGPVHLGAVNVVRATFAHVFGLHSPLSGSDDAILWELRLPRVILAALVGGTRRNQRTPSAMSAGPMLMKSLGPYRPESAPKRVESTASSSPPGMPASPAAAAE